MQASMQECKHASRHASKQESKQAGRQASKQESRPRASKHLEGIQSEPCPVGACSMNKSSSQDHEFVYIFKVLISSKEFEFIEQCSITWI